MKFNDLQSRLWNRMLELIDDYHRKKISFSDLIYGLEGSLDAGEFRNDENIVRQWYDCWTPLEILYATKNSRVTDQDAEEYLDAMQKFLQKIQRDPS